MPTFSLLVPTWNNLPHLRLFVESLRRHSAREHELIVHVNEGSDGTLEWLRERGITHTASAQNLGICQAVNLAAARATGDYLLYFNDDKHGMKKAAYVISNDILALGLVQKICEDNMLFETKPFPSMSKALRWVTMKK